MAVEPVNVLAAVSVQRPEPVFVSDVVADNEGFARAPIELAAMLDPVSVSVLLPVELYVKPPLRPSAPAPLASITAPPVVPAMLITRLLVEDTLPE
jgi:hypothetical protein